LLSQGKKSILFKHQVESALLEKVFKIKADPFNDLYTQIKDFKTTYENYSSTSKIEQ
jgi:hypothetical protein